MAFSDCSGSIPSPSALACQLLSTRFPRPLEPSQVLARFAFRHAMLFDSAKVSEVLAISAPLLIAFPAFRPGRPSDYTLTKLNRLTPRGYGLVVALFTLSPTAHAARPKTRFSAEG